MLIAAARSICAVLALTSSDVCLAREICWIDHVSADEAGVAIYFSSPSSLRVIVQPQGGTQLDVYRVSNGTVTRDAAESPRLELSRGATLYISQGPEDTCTLEVIDEVVRKGVVAKAVNHLPGIPAATASRFIRAEQR